MKRILTTLSQKWPEFLLEILVITIGILGAFALNSWNESKSNRKSKDAFIENVTVEFKTNLEQLDVVLYYDNKVIDASTYFMTLFKKDDLPSDQKLDSVANDICTMWTFDPLKGVLRAAVSSGEIHLIKNERLLQYLFGWEDLVLDARENEQYFVNHQLNGLENFQDRLQLGNIFGHYDAQVPRSSFNSDYKNLLSDPEFENFLVDKIVYLIDARKELLLVRERTVEILTLLEAEK